MLQRLRGWPAGRQLAATQLIDGQGLQLAPQPALKVVHFGRAGPQRMTHRGLGSRRGKPPGPACRTAAERTGPTHKPAAPPTDPWDKSLENARSAARPGLAAVPMHGADHPHLRPSRPTSRTQPEPRRSAMCAGARGLRLLSVTGFPSACPRLGRVHGLPTGHMAWPRRFLRAADDDPVRGMSGHWWDRAGMDIHACPMHSLPCRDRSIEHHRGGSRQGS